MNIKVNIQRTLDFISTKEIQSYQHDIDRHYYSILKKTGKGNEGMENETC